MNDNNQHHLTKHRHFWLFVIGFFVLVSIAAAGPLVYKAYADLASAHDIAVQTKNAQITQAIVSRDYNTWSQLVTDPKLKAEVNSANFNNFAEAYTLLQVGRLEEADVLKKQLGLKEQQNVSVVKSSKITEALADKDYNAWRNIVGAEAAAKVSPAQFETFAKAALLMDAGLVSRAAKLQVFSGMKSMPEYSSSR
jgi:hypothetical protein